MNKTSARRSLWLVVNGKQGEVAGLREGVETLRTRGHQVEVRLTWETGDAIRWSKEAANQGADTVVAGGGDGTVHEVVNGLLQSNKNAGELPALGVLPLGSANDFATACGLHFELPRALQRLPETPLTEIDVGKVNDKFFINMATGGFGTRVTAETPEELKKIFGGTAYFVTGLTRFSGLEPVSVALRGPEFAFEGEVLILAVGNGRQAGGGRMLCPDAALNDGLLDIGVLEPPQKGHWVEAISKVFSAGNEAVPNAMNTARLPWLEVDAPDGLNFNLDGEPIEGKQFRFEVVHKAISMHLPKDCPMIALQASE